ncbi:DEAD/DEAH box helicase [Oceanicoccus sp. KOV_DT_Chl]|uniref:DEAD/DEAH box helicase n=1 Tax=Oceanicoccus sp. KOV_DT_Chl TaxID=1904639 RepID=UPI000C7B2108|nr:AAA domain-containing protein [Oceanicoccus sp. KOV_DT_Chl]
MENRKYFKHKITELEDVYAKAGGDCATLEELEEELAHRSTQRAKKLLINVQNSLNRDDCQLEDGENSASEGAELISRSSASIAVKAPSNGINSDEAINWDELLSTSADVLSNFGGEALKEKHLDDQPGDILDTWTALEALSPQSYKNPKDLVVGKGSVAYLKAGQEPWLNDEKSIPKNNLYYLVYLGAVDLEKATTQLLSIYQDKRIERPQVKGLAALGVILLDKHGVPVPDTGLAISSFGWAYMMAMKGKLSELKYWEVAEKALTEGLDKIIYRQNEEGQVLPFTLQKARQAFDWLSSNYELPIDESVAPSFAIRLYQPFSRGEPDAPLLNSFFLDDLQRAKQAVGTGKSGEALSCYLGIKKPEVKYDVLQDKAHIEKALEPRNMPLSRWPSKGRHSLVLLQQAAVNLAVKELWSDGLFSVNGPPGTGKTTLLRDIIAAVLVKRARALFEFKDAEDAFEHAGKMKLGNSFVHLYKLDGSLRGHEVLVASSNNKAVENVSKELPRKSQIAEDIEELNYFKTLSDELAGDGEDTETWGIIAAVLGNSKNRSAFINKAWWDDNSALQKYFKYITGQLNFEVDEDGEDIIPRIIEECDPPKSLNEAKARWDKARQEFSLALEAAENVTGLAQNAYENYHVASELKIQIIGNRSKQSELEKSISLAKSESDQLKTVFLKKDAELKTQQDKESLSLSKKPGFFKRLFARSQWHSWKSDHQLILSKLVEFRQEYDNGVKSLNVSDHKIKNLETEIIKRKSQEKVLEEELKASLGELKKASAVCDGKLVTPDLWLLNHEEQQIFTPNFTDKAQRLRDDVFISAIKLHKAFIDASGKKLRQNMAAYFACLGGRPLPQDKQHLLPHLWSSAFMVVPVMSTTFASVGRMMKGLPKESLGWLLIDEAGQASPQEAVGAIYRAKRVISVGDPLQIEPIVTLPSSIVEGISKHLGVNPDEWAAPDASVQTLSDNSNIYGTTIPRDLSEIRIGTPLLVHRRCEDPMFSISNKLAYSGLMVHATAFKDSEITKLFGSQTSWIDVRGSAEEKWCPEEGERVCGMLLKASEYFSGDPDIFVITPFRIVAERMRRRMEQEKGRLLSFGIIDPDKWIGNNIGTVHTFQGKEAKAVILLLGAPSPMQNGARNWATSNVNLLNVAVSRAKQNFYVVGNKELWGGLGNMKLVSQSIA